MRARMLICASVIVTCMIPVAATAGGPNIVGGPAVGPRPAFGIDGQPFTWDATKMPIQYRVDPGPMAVNSSGAVVISNSAGLQRVQSMLGVWQGVSTAAVSFSNAGALLQAGSYTGGDLTTVQQYNDVIGSCKSGTQSPIIFDANGTIISGLGLPPEIIGFAGVCGLDTTSGHITAAAVVMNGKFQDGVFSPQSSNYELSANQFDEAITHEIGHFLGLDHSQINVDLLTQHVYPCDVDGLAGMPLMFPVSLCQARQDADLPVLAPDDVAWISTLYPNSNYASTYGTISGAIFFGDGISQVQGANVIARMVDDPNTPEDESRRVAVSVVSGYLFTGNPGQTVTADNTYGDRDGSRNPQLIGYYQIPVPPGTYTVEVESIYTGFGSGSRIGPLYPAVPLPGQPEFWNKYESAFDFPLERDTITVQPGDKITGIDIILNGTPSRFDQYEDIGALFDTPVLSPFAGSKEAQA